MKKLIRYKSRHLLKYGESVMSTARDHLDQPTAQDVWESAGNVPVQDPVIPVRDRHQPGLLWRGLIQNHCVYHISAHRNWQCRVPRVPVRDFCIDKTTIACWQEGLAMTGQRNQENEHFAPRLTRYRRSPTDAIFAITVFKFAHHEGMRDWFI